MSLKVRNHLVTGRPGVKIRASFTSNVEGLINVKRDNTWFVYNSLFSYSSIFFAAVLNDLSMREKKRFESHRRLLAFPLHVTPHFAFVARRNSQTSSSPDITPYLSQPFKP